MFQWQNGSTIKKPQVKALTLSYTETLRAQLPSSKRVSTTYHPTMSKDNSDNSYTCSLWLHSEGGQKACHHKEQDVMNCTLLDRPLSKPFMVLHSVVHTNSNGSS